MNAAREEAVEDAMKIARAYREASEMDTMDALNAQAAKPYPHVRVTVPVADESNKLQNMQYYVVPAAWLRRAWQFVLQPPTYIRTDWLESVAEVDTQSLVADETTTATPPKSWAAAAAGSASSVASLQSPLLAASLEHERDYYFVGRNAWFLLRHKFGLMGPALGCDVHGFASQESNIAVAVRLASSTGAGPVVINIPIPASGRFPYERSLLTPAPAVESTMNNTAGSPSPASITTTHAVPDEPDEATMDDVEEPVKEVGEPQGVLLLPPSTTASPAVENSDNYWDMRDSSSSANNNSNANKMICVQTVRRYRYGSGLASLGNTCYMNSTLQCLGHTYPLQKYFLSGDYSSDLNRDNPLGTGGELAVSFAKLMMEMWTEESTSSSVDSTGWSNTSSNVVYPRDFKYLVGKHAEQFRGYDQHDSQEFATYLLDALHEDTNRISKKPYIEKPEKEEGESDQAAADKAWELHLKREDSRIVENFMGQIKSHVLCCEEGCGRSSTTFDPFMYLSVPIPVSSDRTFNVVFVPLNPFQQFQRMKITMVKTGTIAELTRKTRQEAIKIGMIDDVVSMDDLLALDVWQKDVFAWYKPTDEVDRIRENDVTYVYQLRPIGEIHAASQTNVDDLLEQHNLNNEFRGRHKLDIPTMTTLNKGDTWLTEYGKYLQSPVTVISAFNPSKGRDEDRVKFYNRTTAFLKQCYPEIEAEKGDQATTASVLSEPDVEELPGLVSRCDSSPIFANVKSVHDVAVLEFCVGKMRAEIENMMRARNDSPGGVKVVVRMRGSNSISVGRSQFITDPLIMRIPSNMTVYEFREEIAKRLSRALKAPERPVPGLASAGQPTSEEGTISDQTGAFDGSFGSAEMMIMRQVPLAYEKKAPPYSTKQYDATSPLGSLKRSRSLTADGNKSPTIASPTDSEETQILSHLVGDEGSLLLEWPSEMLEGTFDPDVFDGIEEAPEDDMALMTKKEKANKAITVLDCIAKYCQMEELEETEMWYCNRCKKHVRAWKQFTLYRAPPILIVHLKRFQYSATTHRRDKISLYIDFPLKDLDLTEYVTHWDEGEKPIYDCYAVSNHYGGLGGGHYTAHVLNDDGVWCYYDDSRITFDVDSKEAKTDAAYVLYYRRRDVPVEKDFLLGLETPERAIPGPAVISDITTTGKMTPSASAIAAGYRGAVVDEEDDNMEVDNASRATSPMGSMEGGDDYQAFHDTDERMTDENRLPRQ